jgi:hypothetical protein
MNKPIECQVSVQAALGLQVRGRVNGIGVLGFMVARAAASATQARAVIRCADLVPLGVFHRHSESEQ